MHLKILLSLASQLGQKDEYKHDRIYFLLTLVKNLLYGGYKAVNLIPCVVEREGGTDAHLVA